MMDRDERKMEDAWQVLETQLIPFREEQINARTEDGRRMLQQAREMAQSAELRDAGREEAPSELLYWWKETLRKVPCETLVTRFAGAQVTVSLTSYPARIQHVAAVLRSLMGQTRRPDRILLWLAEEQFPGWEKDLPEELRQTAREVGVEIRWCPDLKPHKKYFYALQEVKEGVVITVDDDTPCPEDLVELLLLSYARHPEAVSAGRVHLITLSGEGEILPYGAWIKETDALVDAPCMQLMAVGVGGTLYPAGCLPAAAFDEEAIRRTCLMADDLWLKAQEVLARVPVVAACHYRKMRMLGDSQTTALWNTNRTQNDTQLQAILTSLEERGEGKAFRDGMLDPDLFHSQIGAEAYCAHANHIRFRLNEELKEMRAAKAKVVETKRRAKREVDRLERENEQLRTELQTIQDSRAYRWGRTVLKPFAAVKRRLHPAGKNG